MRFYFSYSFIIFENLSKLVSKQTNLIVANRQRTDTHKLLHEVTRTVEEIGAKETCDILIEARAKNKAIDFMDFVIKVVCEKYNVSPDDVIKSHSAENKRVSALRFICFYCYNHGIKGLKINQEEIGSKLNRRQPLINRYSQEMKAKRLEKNTQLQKYFTYFDVQIKSYGKKTK